MGRHFQREMEKIKKRLLSLGGIVEERVRMAKQAVEDRDGALCEKIIKLDYEIDELEVEIEEDCLKVMALYQPVAVDLRFLVAVIKINNDLERIGDQVVNIAQRVAILTKRPPLAFDFDYSAMAEKAQDMLQLSLDSLVKMDAALAFKVLTLDDQVDTMQRQAYDRIKSAIGAHPDRGGYLVNLLLISRHLERIGDHATNIAEEVIYLIEGEIVRHGEYPG